MILEDVNDKQGTKAPSKSSTRNQRSESAFCAQSSSQSHCCRVDCFLAVFHWKTGSEYHYRVLQYDKYMHDICTMMNSAALRCCRVTLQKSVKILIS